MFASRLISALVILPLLKACAPQQDAPPPPIETAARVIARYKVVLVAGDGRLPVFDNAVAGVEARMSERASSPADIQRLSAATSVAGHDGIRAASLHNILGAIGAMKPRDGEGCFVFATSHGSAERGLWLQLTGEFLNPQSLDRALVQGCGSAPTVVIMSGCYTGIFARPPMTRANRVVLTAASADRTSFGCGAGRTYTAYDKCLLDAMDAGGDWSRAYAQIATCVRAEERRAGVTASEPQAFFGSDNEGMPLPQRTGPGQ